jgi:hypothetical protein
LPAAAKSPEIRALLPTGSTADGGNETVGAWSEPSEEPGGRFLPQARLIIAGGDRFDKVDRLAVFLEMKNDNSRYAVLNISDFDFENSIAWRVVDASGAPLKQTLIGEWGGPVFTCHTNLILPIRSSQRMNVTCYEPWAPQSSHSAVALGLAWTSSWAIPTSDPKEYFLEGTVHLDKITAEHYGTWSGTVTLPKVRIPRD